MDIERYTVMAQNHWTFQEMLEKYAPHIENL